MMRQSQRTSQLPQSARFEPSSLSLTVSPHTLAHAPDGRRTRRREEVELSLDRWVDLRSWEASETRARRIQWAKQFWNRNRDQLLVTIIGGLVVALVVAFIIGPHAPPASSPRPPGSTPVPGASVGPTGPPPGGSPSKGPGGMASTYAGAHTSAMVEVTWTSSADGVKKGVQYTHGALREPGFTGTIEMASTNGCMGACADGEICGETLVFADGLLDAVVRLPCKEPSSPRTPDDVSVHEVARDSGVAQASIPWNAFDA